MVNGVSFKSGALDSASSILNQPQAQTKATTTSATAPANDVFVPKKKKSVGKTLFKTLIAAAVVAGGLMVGNKTGVLKKLVNKDATGVMKFVSGASEKLNKAGQWLNVNSALLIKKAKGMFNKPATPPTA